MIVVIPAARLYVEIDHDVGIVGDDERAGLIYNHDNHDAAG